MRPCIDAFFDPATGTISYLVHAGPGSAALAIDPVLDYDPAAGKLSHCSADRIVHRVGELQLTVHWLLETHIHADHLSAAHWLRARLGGRIGVGRQVTRVQRAFRSTFGEQPGLAVDGSQFDHLFEDGERFMVGALEVEAIAVPGHTPADLAWRVDDAVFTGDTLFMPDVGTARCDFPGGDARTLYRSLRRLLALPPETRMFVGHDYPPAGRGPAWETSVAEQRARNVHVRDGTGEDSFVAMREARDATLPVPALLAPAIQVNVRAGDLPPPEADGVRYLKTPIGVLGEKPRPDDGARDGNGLEGR